MKLAKQQIAHQFSRAAATYDRVSSVQAAMSNELIAQIPNSASGMLVDFGCGTGWALKQLSNSTGFHLIGIDIAPGMIEAARRRVPAAEFHCCDFETTTLDNDSVDAVFSNAAVQWCNLEATFAEMVRVCKPGGTLHVSTFGPGTFCELKSAWEQSGDDKTRVHTFLTAKRIETALIQTGFERVTVTNRTEVQKFDSVKNLLQSIKQLGATNAAVDRQSGLMGTQRYRRFRNVLEDRLREAGHLQLTYNCVFIQAMKTLPA